jgi:hypothetical protein
MFSHPRNHSLDFFPQKTPIAKLLLYNLSPMRSRCFTYPSSRYPPVAFYSHPIQPDTETDRLGEARNNILWGRMNPAFQPKKSGSVILKLDLHLILHLERASLLPMPLLPLSFLLALWAVILFRKNGTLSILSGIPFLYEREVLLPYTYPYNSFLQFRNSGL